METRAVLRGVRLSVDKGRLVADLIRGKKYDTALNLLNFTTKRAALDIKKALNAAFAEAQQAEADVESLVVSQSTVGDAPRLKRL